MILVRKNVYKSVDPLKMFSSLKGVLKVFVKCGLKRRQVFLQVDLK